MITKTTLKRTIVLSILFVACSKTPPRTTAETRAPNDSTTIRVIVCGVEHIEGRMLLALFASADGFPDTPEKAVLRLQQPVVADSVVFTIAGVPARRYALSIFHDQNANGTMEKDFFGRPNEGYGFSRNARGRMGPPGFDDAAFDASIEPMTIRIDLVYH